MLKKIILALWGISVACVIYASVIPTIDIPGGFDLADKVWHALAYLWLGVLPVIGFSHRHAAFRSVLFVILLGIALEIVQFFLPTRSCELGDAVADTVGTIAGFYLGLFLKKVTSHA